MTDTDSEAYIVRLIAQKARLAPNQVSLRARLVQDLHIDGDDAVDLILQVSRRYAIDVSGFDASRYFRSEPSLLSLLPWQERDHLNKLPLTVGDLVELARNKKLATNHDDMKCE